MGLFLPGTLCYWSYIFWFFSPEENHFNVVSIGQYYRYSFGIYPQSPKLWEDFSPKKAFFQEGGDKPFWEKLWEIALHGGLMIALFKGRGKFYKYIFQ